MVSRYWGGCTLNNLTHGLRYMLKHARPDLLASRSRPRTTATVDPLAAGYWLLAAGYWLLVAGCWLLVAGCWLLVTCCWLLAAGYRGLEAGIRTIGCWLLAVLDRWLWTGGDWAMV